MRFSIVLPDLLDAGVEKRENILEWSLRRESEREQPIILQSPVQYQDVAKLLLFE